MRAAGFSEPGAIPHQRGALERCGGLRRTRMGHEMEARAVKTAVGCGMGEPGVACRRHALCTCHRHAACPDRVPVVVVLTQVERSRPVERMRRRMAWWLAASQPAIVRSWARTQLDAGRLDRYEIGGVSPGSHDAIIAGHIRPLAQL